MCSSAHKALPQSSDGRVVGTLACVSGMNTERTQERVGCAIRTTEEFCGAGIEPSSMFSSSDQIVYENDLNSRFPSAVQERQRQIRRHHPYSSTNDTALSKQFHQPSRNSITSKPPYFQIHRRPYPPPPFPAPSLASSTPAVEDHPTLPFYSSSGHTQWMGSSDQGPTPSSTRIATSTADPAITTVALAQSTALSMGKSASRKPSLRSSTLANRSTVGTAHSTLSTTRSSHHDRQGRGVEYQTSGDENKKTFLAVASSSAPDTVSLRVPFSSSSAALLPRAVDDSPTAVSKCEGGEPHSITTGLTGQQSRKNSTSEESSEQLTSKNAEEGSPSLRAAKQRKIVSPTSLQYDEKAPLAQDRRSPSQHSLHAAAVSVAFPSSSTPQVAFPTTKEEQGTASSSIGVTEASASKGSHLLKNTQPAAVRAPATTTTGTGSLLVPPHSSPPPVPHKQRNVVSTHSNVMGRPSLALSLHIMTTYLAINAKYQYERKLGGKYEDSSGSLIFVSGTLISQRYRVELMLGKGSFGAVFQCVDILMNRRVAVKVVRLGKYFEMQSKMEAKVLKHLHTNPHLRNLVVYLIEKTSWHGHVVLVFELLSFNLFQLLYQTKFNGVSLDLVRKFTWQLLQVFLQLEQHDPPIIHCDLKPENVSLVAPDRSGIRVIDFGSAQLQTPMTTGFEDSSRPNKGDSAPLPSSLFSHARHTKTGGGELTEGMKRRDGSSEPNGNDHSGPPQSDPPTSQELPHNSETTMAEPSGESSEGPPAQQPGKNRCFPHYIQSRYYRSPEVILQLGYTCAIDRWSLACMLVELHTGRPLFQGIDEAHMLECFVRVLGPIPSEMIEKSPRKDHFFATVTRANDHVSSDRQQEHCSTTESTSGAPTGPTSDHFFSVDGARTLATAFTSSGKARSASTPPLMVADSFFNPKSLAMSSTAGSCVDHQRSASFPCHSSTRKGSHVSRSIQKSSKAYFSQFSSSSNAPETCVDVPHHIRSEGGQSGVSNDFSLGKTQGAPHGGVASSSSTTNTPSASLLRGIAPTAGASNHIFSFRGEQLQNDGVERNSANWYDIPSKPQDDNSTVRRSTSFDDSSGKIVQPSSSSETITTYYLLPRQPKDAGKKVDTAEQSAKDQGSPKFLSSPSAPPPRAETSNSPYTEKQRGEEINSPTAVPLIEMKASTSLHQILGVSSGGPRGCRNGQEGHDEASYSIFLDFISRLLTYDPEKRMSCLEATQHPFLAPLSMCL